MIKRVKWKSASYNMNVKHLHSTTTALSVKQTSFVTEYYFSLYGVYIKPCVGTFLYGLEIGQLSQVFLTGHFK